MAKAKKFRVTVEVTWNPDTEVGKLTPKKLRRRIEALANELVGSGYYAGPSTWDTIEVKRIK